MLLELEKKVLEFIKFNEFFGLAERVLLAVSGGADSTALMHLMCALKKEGFFEGGIICVHLNHQLRGEESDGDEEFVIEQGGKLNIEVVTRRFDVREYAKLNKLSIETAGRELRIKKLVEIAEGKDCRYIVTAHHKGDNAETLLQRIARGTGVRGLCGIWPVREFEGIIFVRPILCGTREEIIGYLNERGLEWRTDRTNKDFSYRRNYIRHRLIPELQKESKGSIVERLSELSRAARGFYKLVCERAEKVWSEGVDVSEERVEILLGKFLSEHVEVKAEVLRRALSYLGSGERDLSEGHIKGVLELAEENISGRRIELPGGFSALKEYDSLIFGRGENLGKVKEKAAESRVLEVGGEIEFGGYRIKTLVLEAKSSDIEKFKKEKDEYVEWFDHDKLELPLSVRYRQEGDRFEPIGLGKEKKVGKFLTDSKVRQKIRDNLFILCDSKRIVWVWPVRISEEVKVTADTQKIIQLQIIRVK